MFENIDKEFSIKIFNHLKDGKILSSNNPNKELRKLFSYIELNFVELKNIYSYVGVEFVLKNAYAYFSSFENKEARLKIILELIDILDFFISFNANFEVSSRFKISEIVERVIDDITLKAKLEKLKIINDDTLEAKVKALVLKLEKYGFVACEDSYLQKYIVLDSIEYLNDFFRKIEIKE